VTYDQLAMLQEKYQSKGFSVLAFPTNDFHQELGSDEEIKTFVSENFPQVTFPIFGLGSLNENVVYQQLQRQLPSDNNNQQQQVHGNFFKYLVDQNGVAVAFFNKQQDPLTMESEIEKLLLGPTGTTTHHRAVTQ
jgi:glutathione peroxidase